MVRLAAFTLTVAACVMAQTCPCGERDPFADDADALVSAEHAPADHCFCQCGDDPEQRMPPTQTCSAFEGPCERADRTIAQLECR